VALVAYSALVGVVVSIAVIYWGLRGSRRTRPGQIVKRLRASGGPVTLQIRALGTTWKPSPSGRSDRLFGSARAVYTLDETGSVHLAWQGTRGAEQHFVGAIPESALADAPKSPQRRLLRRLIVGYVVFLAVAFVLGYSLAGGSIAKRLIVAVASLFGAMLLVSIATTVIRVAISVRSVVRDQTKAS